MKMRSSSHKYSLICRQGACTSYYNRRVIYVSGLNFKVTFAISANFAIQTFFLNFNKTLFDLR